MRSNKNRSFTIWFTGLPCSGKTTLGKRLKKELEKSGLRTVHLDAEKIRKSINKDLGFSEEDRRENLRRVAHIARLFNENGIHVTASFIAPTKKMRKMIRKIIGRVKFVYLKCSLEECERRDTRDMYQKARLGEIKEFTGISAPYEKPIKAFVIDTEKNSINRCIQEITNKLDL